MCDGTLPQVSSARRGGCETSVEYGLPLWAEPAVGYCTRRPCPSPMWGSRFVLGGSSCMVKITPNATNFENAKEQFFTGSVF